MSQDIVVLRNKRGGKKRSLTSFATFIYQSSENENLTQIQIIEIKKRLEKIELIYNQFCDIQAEIESFCDSDALVAEYTEQENFESEYFKSISLAQSIIDKYYANNANSAGSNLPSSVSSTSERHANANVKLPTIQIPKFSGVYEQWVEFRDIFVSLIHNNNELEDIQKLHYLKSNLSAAAADTIKSVQISQANYNVAWKLLCDRYDNKKLLINNHIKFIFNIPTIKRESASDLRRLLDDLSKHLLSLDALGQETNHWSLIIIYLITSKLDNRTQREWETSRINETNLPTIEDFKIFLKGRCEMLETIDRQQEKTFNKTTMSNTVTFQHTKNKKCSYCNKLDHFIYYCPKFLNLDIQTRIHEIKQRKLCQNCLRSNHSIKDCKSTKCRHCSGNHNSLIHNNHNNPSTMNESAPSDNTQIATTCNQSYIKGSSKFLATAIVQIKTNSKNSVNARTLLDCGSEINFISNDLCNKLNLRKTKYNVSIVGIGQKSSNTRYKVELEINSKHTAFKKIITCIVIDEITGHIPTKSQKLELNIPHWIKLSDPNFNIPNKIDLLIGVDTFWDLICPEQINLGKNKPILRNTLLGWIISGTYLGHKENNHIKNNLHCHLSVGLENQEIQNQLKQFWEIEECQVKRIMNKEERHCEENFSRTIARNDTGRFIVTIPFRDDKPSLGRSFEMVLQQFNSLERRLGKNEKLKLNYIQFMQTYENLGHMSKIKNPDINMENSYYLPHHGVIKEDSTSTKLRVVFNGSFKTTNNKSLNDNQFIGPTIQQELVSIVLRSRTHKFILSADVKMMYRQILVNQSQRDYQRILWRNNPTDPLNHFTLNTVTYGTSSAPYLAIKCLQQAAIDKQDQYPQAAKAIMEDFYVDDLLTGASTVEEALQLHQEITIILESACFQLRKWMSNSEAIRRHLTNKNTDSDVLYLSSTSDTKTLGLIWSPITDILRYKSIDVKLSNETKRSLLSKISQFYDPLGLIGPCFVIPKLIIQRLWKYNLDWDDPIPEDISNHWNNFCKELPILFSLKIPRYICHENAIIYELHAFSDASNTAYGSCIYVRCVTSDQQISVNLLCSKAKVTPIKALTIPRLELCAALLSVRLKQKIVQSITNINFNKVFYWSDSRIVLNWIKLDCNSLKIFVAHRISEIQETTNFSEWHYVESQSNPADLISRGIFPSKLSNSIWFTGPAWLSHPKDSWPNFINSAITCESLPEIKQTNLKSHVSKSLETDSNVFSITNSFSKLVRIIAWCQRFIGNCQSHSSFRNVQCLSALELDKATNCLIKLAQTESFNDEIQFLQSNDQTYHKKLKYRNLSPFIDSHGLLRVGGRLKHSNFNFNKKHPILLSGKHILTKMIFQSEHVRLLHANPQLLLSSIRQKYWPLNGRNLARNVTHNCVTCFKVKPSTFNQVMGDLPLHRVHFTYPFYAVGTDYAGPFLLRTQRGRKYKTFKCYVCLFVCLATKAIHLEPVTDLTTESFIATFRRFTSRRGKPTHVYSDNGTNYVGASSELTELGTFITKNNTTLTNSFTSEQIQWHFIPANSPHFGGLWEAGVKSTKFHLRRVLQNSLVTLEDFFTVLAQIEGVLNSRPLHPMSQSPDDQEPLTPSHFLIGRNMSNLPDPDLAAVPQNRLSQYQHLQRLVWHFWKRWSNDYIHELQQKSKWFSINKSNVQAGQLVIIKENNLPPLRWKLGRITETIPGSDGVVRVVLVKTANGVIKRAINRLAILPLSEHNTN